MHILHSAPASPALSPFVRAYAQRQTDGSGPDLVQPVPASLEHILEFEFLDPPLIAFDDGHTMPAYPVSLVGSHTHPGIHLHLSGKIQSFAIFFEPLGLWQLFRIPSPELADTYYKAPDVLGETIQHLWSQLADCTSFAQRVAAAERYLLKRAMRPSTCTPIMQAATFLFQNRGTHSIQSLATSTGLGLRQFERRFFEDIGIAPKLFARITRFQMALDRKLTAPDCTWLSIAHEFGYHDQMHMIRDFHGLGGASPTAILAELGDTRPPALSASNPAFAEL